MLKRKTGRVIAWLAIPLFFAQTASGTSLGLPRDSEAFAYQGPVTVTQADLDAYLDRIPEEHRGGFLLDNERLAQAIENLLLVRLLGHQAIENGLLEEPVVQGSLYQTAMVYLADERRKRYLDENMLDDYEQQARELYLTQPSMFEVPASLSFSHILVNRGQGRGELEAMERIFEVYEKLQDGAEFDALVGEYSDDPYVDDNQGSYENVALDELEGEVAQALQLMQPGQISEPVLSDHGWHIIRLDARDDSRKLSWEEAEDQAREIARNQHREELVDSLYRDALQAHPFRIEPGSVEKLLERYGVRDAGRPTDDSISEQASGADRQGE
ncbi:MAG: hypothetical protein GVY32_07570 [Gammaproteobacteria bacterium]|nr:hypothetical protein [Gammaproteobacteria bacterium]